METGGIELVQHLLPLAGRNHPELIRDMLEPDMVLIGESDSRAGDVVERLYSGICENDPPFRRMSLVNAELTKIATAGGGRYYELDRETDRDIANQIIDQTRRRAGSTGIQEGTRELYWNFLFAAGVFLALGVLFLRDRVALALQLAAATAVFLFISAVF